MIVTNSEDSSAWHTARAVAYAKDGEAFVYLHLFGMAKAVRGVVKALKKSKGRYYAPNAAIKKIKFFSGKTLAPAPKPLSKGKMEALVVDSKLSSSHLRYIVGRDMEECYRTFHKWMHDIQILPAPVDSESEQTLFDLLLEWEAIEPLESEGVIAYKLDASLEYGGETMQDAIREVLVRNGLLGIDRLRKRLKTAPAISDVNPDYAQVFVDFVGKETTYRVVGYEPDQDLAMTMAVSEDGQGWEEYKLSDLFNNNDLGINEPAGLVFIDGWGKEIKEEAA